MKIENLILKIKTENNEGKKNRKKICNFQSTVHLFTLKLSVHQSAFRLNIVRSLK